MSSLFDDLSSFAPPPTDDKLLHGLNPEQRRAVTLPDEHALILAGAGSGKTRVLTTRIAWLLQQQRVSPGGLMAVTFTNKAAKEMNARLSAMLPLNVRGMWIGTFHGLCNRFLRAHYQVAGLPQGFQILDTQDQLSAIKRLYKQHGVSDDQFPAKQMQWFISGCKEEGMRPGDVPVHDGESRRKAEIYQLYEEQCQREGVVDFGELMLRSYEILRDYPLVRQHYQRRFRHILVDEFQDTNRLQYLWLKQLVSDGKEGVPANAPSAGRRAPPLSLAPPIFGATILTRAPSASTALRSADTCAASVPSSTRMPTVRPRSVGLFLPIRRRAGETGRSRGFTVAVAAGGSWSTPKPSATRLAKLSSMWRRCESVRRRTAAVSTFDSSNTKAKAMCACSISLWLLKNCRGCE